MHLEYCNSVIWGTQSSSFNSITPNSCNCIILFTQIMILKKYIENTILTLAAPEFELKRVIYEKKIIFK